MIRTVLPATYIFTFAHVQLFHDLLDRSFAEVFVAATCTIVMTQVKKINQAGRQ